MILHENVICAEPGLLAVEIPFVCPLCDRRTSRPAMLGQHDRPGHEAVRYPLCRKCATRIRRATPREREHLGDRVELKLRAAGGRA